MDGRRMAKRWSVYFAGRFLRAPLGNANRERVIRFLPHRIHFSAEGGFEPLADAGDAFSNPTVSG